MKHLSKFFLAATAVLLFASCTEGKMKKFAEEFSAAVNNGDTAAINQMYPDAKQAEKLATVNFVKDSVKVEEVADTFVVRLGGETSMAIVKDNEGNLHIADSHGLFAWPEERMDFAKKTGWVKDGMSDLTIAKQFTDTTFVKYLSQKNVGQIKTKLVVRNVSETFSNEMFFDKHYNQMMPTLYVTATVVNNSDFDISGTDYEVTVSYLAVHTNTFPGKDIKKGETQTFTIKACPQETRGSASLRFLTSDADLLAKYFSPTGNEYQEYLRSPIADKK